MKYMIGLMLFLAYGSTQAIMGPGFVMSKAFFKATWNRSADGTKFTVAPRWTPDIPMTYNGKQYLIRSGRIIIITGDPKKPKSGTIDLFAEGANGKLETVLTSKDMTQVEIKDFLTNFGKGGDSEAKRENEGGILLDTATTKGPALNDYHLVTSLLLARFPGLKIG
jgi:hypothetical protein